MSEIFLNEEELMLQNTVREFSLSKIAPRASDFDQNEKFPSENFHDIATLGLLGLEISPKYGGSGGTARQQSIVVEQLARACAATSTIYIAHLSLCCRFISMYGSENQKREILPGLVSGSKVGAFALTESVSGSDAAGMITTLKPQKNGFIINGSKTYITNAVEASTIIVMATIDPKLRSKGVNALIVDSKSPGITINPIHGKMGIRASSIAEIVFENVFVPKENLISNESNGFKNTMNVLNASRISIAAQCVGIAQSANDAALDYTQNRKAFGQNLSEFQGIQWQLADIATEIEAARLLTLKAATLRDSKKPFIKEASMAKLFGSKIAVKSANTALQIHGGLGYISPTPVERYYRDAKITEIYEGSSEIQKLIIARNILSTEK